MRYVVKVSRRQEKVAAADLGGKVQPGSGNQWHSKGDVKNEHLLMECKTTEGVGFRVTVETLRKIEGEAQKQGGRMPVLQVEFNTVGARREKYAVVRWADFVEMWHATFGNGEGR